MLKSVSERLDVRKMTALAFEAVPAGTVIVRCASWPFCMLVASSIGLGSKLVGSSGLEIESAVIIHGVVVALDQPLTSKVKLCPAATVCTVPGVAVALKNGSAGDGIHGSRSFALAAL